MRRVVGFTLLGDAPAADVQAKFQAVLAQARAVLAQAQVVTGIDSNGQRKTKYLGLEDDDQIPEGTPSSVADAWKKDVADLTTSTQDGLPFLTATMPKAVADPTGYGARWLGTAKAVQSELTQILGDQQLVGLANAIEYAAKQTGIVIEDAAEKAVPKLAFGAGAVVGAYLLWKVLKRVRTSAPRAA